MREEKGLGLSSSQSLCHNHLSIAFVVSLALALWIPVKCWDMKGRTLLVGDERSGAGAKAHAMQYSKTQGRGASMSMQECQIPRSDGRGAWQGLLSGTEEAKIKAGFSVPCFTAALILLHADVSVACTSSFCCLSSLDNIVPSQRGHTRRLSSQDKLLRLRLLWIIPCQGTVFAIVSPLDL